VQRGSEKQEFWTAGSIKKENGCDCSSKDEKSPRVFMEMGIKIRPSFSLADKNEYFSLQLTTLINLINQNIALVRFRAASV